MILRARNVVTMHGPPIENGAVAISGNRIVDVGTFDGGKASNSGEVVDLGEQTLLPGLINTHCHLDYTCLRGKILPQKSFTDWIRAINAEKAKLSPESYVNSIKEGFAEAKKFGTTTIANLTAFPELIGKIDEPIRTWWFAELIDVREPHRARELVDLAVQSLTGKKNWGLAPHAPFTASANLYRHCQEVAPLLTTHLAESREEMEMFRDGAGLLYKFMKEFGRDMSDCGHETPLAHFLAVRDLTRSSPDSLAATVAAEPSMSLAPLAPFSTPLRSGRNDKSFARSDKQWIVAHLNELVESDFDLLPRSAAKFHIVHCPRSHSYFGHSRFPFERLRGLGFNVCLGTDSLASNEDLSLFAEMRQFQKSEPGISPEEILTMVTVKAALALAKPDLLGKLGAGYWADMIALPSEASRQNLFEEIVAFDGTPTMSMIDGEMSGPAGGRSQI